MTPTNEEIIRMSRAKVAKEKESNTKLPESLADKWKEEDADARALPLK